MLGFQECREGFNTLLADVKATGYASVVDKLVDDPNDSTIINCVPILYNTDRFTLVEGSAGARRFVEKYGDSWTKSLCYCVTSQKYIVINVHFAVYSDDYGLTANEVRAQRVSNAYEVLAQIETMQKTYGDIPVIAMGDFNTDEPEKAYRVLISELVDTAYIADKSEPFISSSHTSLTELQTGGYPIDHVFVSGNCFTVTNSLPYMTTTSRSASDHFPVYADLTYEKTSGQTCDEAHVAEAPIVVLDVVKRTPFNDTLEGFTIMNVSTKPVDLSHILAWYGRSETEEGLDALTASDVTRVMRLSEKRGENILAPGEKAYIWCFFNSSYTVKVTTADGEKAIVSKGKDGKPVYNIDAFREAWEYLSTQKNYDVKPLDSNIKVIPLDSTTRDTFSADGTFRYLESSFNMANAYYARLYVSYDDAIDIDDAFCYVDLDGTGNGTYINSEGNVVSPMGMYSFVPSGEPKFMASKYVFGGFTVADVLSALKNCINGNYAEIWDMNGDGHKNMIDVIRVLRTMAV